MAIWHLETWRQLTSRLRFGRNHLEQKGFTRLYFRLWQGRIILSASVTHREATSTSGLGSIKILGWNQISSQDLQAFLRDRPVIWGETGSRGRRTCVLRKELEGDFLHHATFLGQNIFTNAQHGFKLDLK